MSPNLKGILILWYPDIIVILHIHLIITFPLDMICTRNSIPVHQAVVLHTK